MRPPSVVEVFMADSNLDMVSRMIQLRERYRQPENNAPAGGTQGTDGWIGWSSPLPVFLGCADPLRRCN
jgi:hypothetical protein